MSTVALSTSPTQLNDGTGYEVLVVNSGTVDAYLARGQQAFRLKPGASRTVQPEGTALTGQVMVGTGQVTTTVTTSSNPSAHGALGTDGHLYPA